MIAFTESEIHEIRDKARRHPEFIQKILKDTELVRKKVYIQKTALGTWEQFYLCPKHTVPLTLNYYDNKHHVCPIDGEIFTGEPYDGSWWCYILDKNFAACHSLAVAYLATEDEKYLERVHDILIGYATYYPSYEVHGNIPYNKPAKAYAQVLNDSFFMNSLARAYDMTKETFTEDEQKLIENDLLLEGAVFLKNNGTPQLHNHEVATCSAIGIIGIILNREDLIDYALNAKYGLKYQLDNAILEDGMWFEGTAGYHLYALNFFLKYEKFARHTKYALMIHPHYREKIYTMLTFTNKMWKQNNTFPCLNDNAGSMRGQFANFEYGYTYFRDEETLWALKQCIGNEPRTSVETLLYGVENLPDTPNHEYKNYYSLTGSSMAIIYGSDQRHFFYKACPYGGEHDHYDRLGISFSAFGEDVCADLGTAKGYGAPLHYAYYKNTGTHNTVVINGDNMPPANPNVISFNEISKDNIYLDARVSWSNNFKMPDMHTIKQWSHESYDGVVMQRTIQWYDKYFIDIFTVDAPNELSKDYTLHINGRLQTPLENLKERDTLSNKNPQKNFHDVMHTDGIGVVKSSYKCNGFDLTIHTLADHKEMIYALGPNNPSTSDISYLLERTFAKQTVYVNIIEAHRENENMIDHVDIKLSDNTVHVNICEKSGKTKSFSKRIIWR